MIKVSAPSRIHLGLCDVSSATFRRYGGVGIALKGPKTLVSATPSDRMQLESRVALSPRDHRDAESCLARLAAEFPHATACVQVEELPPQHVGLGSKTSLLLTILIAATECNGVTLDRATLRNLSRRGGASGVGVHTFFDGGIVVDAGHKVLPSSPDAFSPSSATSPSAEPLLVHNIPPPSDWRVTLMLPEGRIIEGEEEQAIFRGATPMPEDDALRTIALIYHGLVPGAIEEDLTVFGSAICEMQGVGLKRVEVSSQPAEVSATMTALRNRFPAVGLSSMGPLIYAIDSGEVSAQELDEVAGGATVLGTFEIADSGYETLHA